MYLPSRCLIQNKSSSFEKGPTLAELHTPHLALTYSVSVGRVFNSELNLVNPSGFTLYPSYKITLINAEDG